MAVNVVATYTVDSNVCTINSGTLLVQVQTIDDEAITDDNGDDGGEGGGSGKGGIPVPFKKPTPDVVKKL